MISLSGMRLSYLLDQDSTAGAAGRAFVLGYDAPKPPAKGLGILYRNAFDEKNSGRYPPYLPDDDVSGEYSEGRIDPKGRGWVPHLEQECRVAVAAGFKVIECFDNLDSYQDVGLAVDACGIANRFGLFGLAKNPNLFNAGHVYLQQTNIIGAVVEHDPETGSSDFLQGLRITAQRPTLPIYFAARKAQRTWAQNVAKHIARMHYKDMFVTWSPKGGPGVDYPTAVDIL